MRFRLIALSLLFVVVAVAGVWTRQASPAQLALEAAKRTELIDRNLPAAIGQYRDVAARFESDATVAPTALLQLAGCYEQLRQPEARATYEQIVKYYPNSAPAKTARVKLAEKREVGFTTTKLTEVIDGAGAPSLDGRYFTGSDSPSGDLVVRDTRSGKIRALTHIAQKAHPSDYPIAVQSVPSPDGRQIAYSWAPNDDAWQLRVINHDGSQEKVLCCREQAGEIPQSVTAVYGWSGDGKQILFSTTRSTSKYVPEPDTALELMTVPATGGAPRILKQLRGVGAVFSAGWSPDARFIVYDARATDSKGVEHDLFIMRADGSNSEPLVTHAGHKQMLDWFPDGNRILFLSDFSGSNSVWAQNIVDGRSVGEPTLVKALVGRLRGQGFTAEGAYYYNVISVYDDVLTARLNPSGILSEKFEPLPSRFFSGKQGGVWSPDGSKIAYVHVPFGVTSGPSLLIQTVSTREVEAIPVQLRQIANPVWLPDGRALIVDGRDTKGAQGLFRIELSSGAVSTIGELTTTSAGVRNYPAVSPNGREVFYGLGGGILKGIQAQDLVSGALRMVFDGPVMNFALSPDGRFVAIASPNRENATDQTPSFRIVPSTGGESRAIGTELVPIFQDTGFTWSSDGRYLYFARATAERRMVLWRIPVSGGPAVQTNIPVPNRRLSRISLNPDGVLAISTQGYDLEYFVMRNIPPAAKR